MKLLTAIPTLICKARDRMLRSIESRLTDLSERIDFYLLDARMHHAGVYTMHSIKTWMTRRELGALYRLAISCPIDANALEIGSYLGASSCYLAAGLAEVKGHLICVDTWQNDTIEEGPRDTFAEFQHNVAGVRSYITVIRKRSDRLTEDEVGKKIHLVFLDGDHSYDVVSCDTRFVTPMIAENGILAFHDAIAMEGVARTIGECLAAGGWQFGGHIDNLVWLKKVRWVEPTYTPPNYA